MYLVMNNLQEVKLLCKIFSRSHSLHYAKHALKCLIFYPSYNKALPGPLMQRDMGVFSM